MKLKRLFIKRLMAVLEEDYWEATVAERLHRLKAIMPTKYDHRLEHMEDLA